MKRALTLEFGDEVLLALGLSPEQFGEEVKLLTAVKLYEMGRLSAGAASRLAEIPEPLFLSKLADYGVDSFRLTDEELRQDLAHARSMDEGFDAEVQLLGRNHAFLSKLDAFKNDDETIPLHEAEERLR